MLRWITFLITERAVRIVQSAAVGLEERLVELGEVPRQQEQALEVLEARAQEGRRPQPVPQPGTLRRGGGFGSSTAMKRTSLLLLS